MVFDVSPCLVSPIAVLTSQPRVSLPLQLLMCTVQPHRGLPYGDEAEMGRRMTPGAHFLQHVTSQTASKETL